MVEGIRLRGCGQGLLIAEDISFHDGGQSAFDDYGKQQFVSEGISFHDRRYLLSLLWTAAFHS